MRDKGSKLSRKQQIVIGALLESTTIKVAAQNAGVGEASIYRWLQDYKFRCAFRDAKRRVVEQAVTHLQQACGEAVDVLRLIMQDSNSPANSRVSSARTILDMAIRAVEIEDLTSRIERLEQVLQ
jgi:DNA-binding MurR/RpiR family transcriptional regulator